MPHSNDNTVVTAAGDSEVRVFDLEHAGRSAEASNASSVAAARHTIGLSTRGLGNVYHGVKYLSDGNTNARVYRSHSDRVKRIVTESSPYLFLTCSEDGEVRQFDTRLPSSAYPAARGGGVFQLHAGDHDDSNVPPPLISYRRYRLDLNTISCSPSQPHYIVLGGAHLHCFLHDRRMAGRDVWAERGDAGVGPSSPDGTAADSLMGEATQCVKRFAPNGKTRMGRTENGHVTACKISDAHPNEMIASWSGDHIYSFDLLHSPDARDKISKPSSTLREKNKNRTRESRDRKRKRKAENTSASMEGLKRGDSRARRTASQTASDDVVLRVRYENGQSEDISIEPAASERFIQQSRESVLNESQKRSMRIGKSVVKIRKLLFSLEASAREDEHGSGRLSAHIRSFTSVLGLSAALLPELDDVIRTWPYPVGPSPQDVAFHATLRQHRDSVRRFVQACGTLAQCLGGRIHTAGASPSAALEYFDTIKASETEGPLQEPDENFRYVFLKAITLWLGGGPEALLEGFKKKASTPKRQAAFFPIPEDANLNGIEEHLVPMLIQLARTIQRSQAGPRPISNVDASRFETDENRILFRDETAAVIAFSRAIQIPLQDMSGALTYLDSGEGTESSQRTVQAQDKQAALKYWGFKVGRGLLMNAGEGVNFAFVDRAYGGLGLSRDIDEGRVQDNIDSATEEQVVDTADVVSNASPVKGEPESAQNGANNETPEEVHVNEPEEVNEEASEDDDDDDGDDDDDDGDDDDDDSDDDGDDNDSDDGDDDGEADEDDGGLASQFILRSTSERNRLRSQVQKDVPVMAHSRKYTGHCNVKTVKDVNFFGLQDEYVVSGCDSGHLFIWDRKTSRLLNILKGDGEVVNVVQGTPDLPRPFPKRTNHMIGHPYEPMLAVSGIDHTIKIFSPDHRAQRDARLGRNLNIDPTRSTNHSSLNWPLRRQRPRSTTNDDGEESQPPVPPAVDSDEEEPLPDEDDDDDGQQQARPRACHVGLESRRRMHDSYKIILQNDIDRAGGNNEAYITVSGPSFPLRRIAMEFSEWISIMHQIEGNSGGGGAGGGEND